MVGTGQQLLTVERDGHVYVRDEFGTWWKIMALPGTSEAAHLDRLVFSKDHHFSPHLQLFHSLNKRNMCGCADCRTTSLTSRQAKRFFPRARLHSVASRLQQLEI